MILMLKKSCLYVLTLLTFSVATITAEEAQRNWDNATPTDYHQKLWESKVKGMTDRVILQDKSAAVSTQTNYDVLYYNIYIKVNDTTQILDGRVTFVAQSASAGVTSVEVDLYNNMSVDSIIAPSGPLSYTRAGDIVTVLLGGTYNTGDPFEFDFYYSGHPIEGGFQAFSFSSYSGIPVISSLSEPYFARTWWPCKDRMDDKADSFDIAIEVDTSLYVGSNGTLDSTVAGGAPNSHIYYYNVDYPMVTYLFSVAISQYAVWTDEWVYNSGIDTLPLVHAVFPTWYTYSLTHYDVTPQVLQVFSDKFGPYPYPTEKYGHSNFTWGGGMEHQTMTSMGGSSFGFSEPVVVHEAAHQWWGDYITCTSWQDIWLNEGWASYAEAVYYLETQGWSAYHSYMFGMDYPYGGTIYCQYTTSVGGIFTSRVYDKGAWALHMLRGVLGEADFATGVTAWYNSQYKYADATTEDFKNVLEVATGVELDWFFDQWIHGTYRPNYRWEYMTESDGAGGYNLYLRVNQVQTTAPQVFTMPVDFYFTGPNDTLTLAIDQRQTRITLNFPVNVTNVTLDPVGWVMNTNLKLTWDMNIITLYDGLSAGTQYLPYVDTIEVRGGSTKNTWSVTSGTLPPGLTLGSDGIISGSPTDTGTFVFTALVDDNHSTLSDEVDFAISIAYNPGMPGDINNDGDLNVADLTYLVEWLFKGGPAPVIMNSADVNASCSHDVDDLTYLVAFLFQSGPTPLPGCFNK